MQALVTLAIMLVAHVASAQKSVSNPIPLSMMRTSTNFALHWGSDSTLSDGQADFFLAAFENAWQATIVDRSLPAPAGTEDSLFNVYIGTTDDDRLSVLEFGNSAMTYADCTPFVVVGRGRVEGAVAEGDTGYAEALDDFSLTATHEFFHTVQVAFGWFPYRPVSPAPCFEEYDEDIARTQNWMFEASANWLAMQVFESDRYIRESAPSFLLTPYLPADYWIQDVRGNFEDLFLSARPYGAAIFLQHLSEHTADPDLVLDMWRTAREGESPFDVLARLLEQRGTSLREALADFAARNAVLDYARAEDYRGAVADAVLIAPELDFRFAAEHLGGDSGGFVRVPADTAPLAFGYNVIALRDLPFGQMAVSLRGDPMGTEGTASAFDSTLVVSGDAGPSYTRLSLSAGEGVATAPVEAGDDAFLVVSAWAETRTFPEQFSFEYQAVVEPRADPDAGPDADPGDAGSESACSCRIAAPRSPVRVGLVGFLVIGLLVRRREEWQQHEIRRRASPGPP